MQIPLMKFRVIIVVFMHVNKPYMTKHEIHSLSHMDNSHIGKLADTGTLWECKTKTQFLVTKLLLGSSNLGFSAFIMAIVYVILEYREKSILVNGLWRIQNDRQGSRSAVWNKNHF